MYRPAFFTPHHLLLQRYSCRSAATKARSIWCPCSALLLPRYERSSIWYCSTHREVFLNRPPIFLIMDSRSDVGQHHFCLSDRPAGQRLSLYSSALSICSELFRVSSLANAPFCLNPFLCTSTFYSSLNTNICRPRPAKLPRLFTPAVAMPHNTNHRPAVAMLLDQPRVTTA